MFCRIVIDKYLDNLDENQSLVAHMKGLLNNPGGEKVRIFLHSPAGSGKSALCYYLQREIQGLIICNTFETIFPFYATRKSENTTETKEICEILREKENKRTDVARVLIMEDCHLLANKDWDDFLYPALKIREIIDQYEKIIITSDLPLCLLSRSIQEILKDNHFQNLELHKLQIDSKRKIINQFAVQYGLSITQNVTDALLKLYNEDIDMIKEHLMNMTD